METTGWISLLFGLVIVAALVYTVFYTDVVDSLLFTRADDTGWTVEGVIELADANNQFAFDLYEKLNEAESGNIFFSPYSITSSGAMVYEGARGQTADEMRKVFGYPADDTMRRSASAHIYNTINTPKKAYRLHTANALWSEQTYDFLPEYIDLAKDYFGATVKNMDFIGDPDGSEAEINDWVEQQTNGRIKDILSPGSIEPLTRLIVTNAIYFKGDWKHQFDKDETKKDDFRTATEQTVQVDMMHFSDDDIDFNYTETDSLQMLELPYKGDDLSMILLLPKEDNGVTLADIESELSASMFSVLRNDMMSENVRIWMPKFEFDTKYDLEQTLIEMGMPTAFTSPGADFSGMDGTRELFIGKVVHQAFVKVDEEGTEAAAATAWGVVGAAIPKYKEFRADHPFIFIIQQCDTGNILFLGRVVDPR